MKIVIVGGVAGGATAAARCRRLNETASIKVFERGPFVSFANCGLPYYIGNTINDRDDLLLADPELFRSRFNIDVYIEHELIGIDRNQKQVKIHDLKSQRIFEEPYDYLILSPGAVPFKPAQTPGYDLPGVFTLRNIPDSDDIKQWTQQHTSTGRAVIIGGGFIGLEMAENMVHLGKKVTLIERSRQVMPPFDPEMVSQLQTYLQEQHGMDLKMNTSVKAVVQTDSGLRVEFEGSREHIDADVIVLAIGIRPDTTLAQSCGLKLGITGGVKVDHAMRTSDQSIYAVGDCVETTDVVTQKPIVLALAGPANRQARIAADNIMGRNVAFRGVEGTAVCKVFDMVVACTGASEKTLKRYDLAYQKIYLHPNQHVGYYPGASKIAIKLMFHPETGKVLGAQAIGKEGVEKRIDVLSMAIQSGMTVFDLEQSELCYAPQVGAAKDPVNLAGMIASGVLRGDQPVAHWQDIDVKASRILDVRSKGEYDQFHVDGATLIPLPELRSRLNELDPSQPIYVHCAVGQRGYYGTCLLRQHGFKAFNLSGGVTTYKMLKGMGILGKL